MARGDNQNVTQKQAQIVYGILLPLRFTITNLSVYLIVEINNGIIFKDPLAKPMTLRIKYGTSELQLKGHNPAVASPSGIIVQFW